MAGGVFNIHRWHPGMVGVIQTSPGVSWMDMEDGRKMGLSGMRVDCVDGDTA